MKHIFHLFLFLISFSNPFSQKLDKDYHLKHTIRQDNQQFQFSVLDFDDKGVYDYNKGKFYYWLKSQKVHVTQGYSSGLLLDGEFQSFYDSKQLSQRGYFFKGLKNGEWLHWNEKGVLIQIEHWKSGEKCGVEKIFDNNGELITKIKHKNNKIERWTKDSLIIENTSKTEKKIIVFDARSRKVSVTRLKHKELDGKQEIYKEGKLEKVEFFDDGKKYEKKSLKDRCNKLFKKDKSSKEKDKSGKTKKDKESKTKKSKTTDKESEKKVKKKNSKS